MAPRAAMAAVALGAALLAAGCRRPASPGEAPSQVRLTFAAFSVAREAYGRAILPAFAAEWRRTHPGEPLEIRETYEGSGAQTRAILGGLRVDVAALTLPSEVERLQRAGLVRSQAEDVSVPAFSAVVLVVRPGNPKRIVDWRDLERQDVRVLMANPDTSGSARWNVAAMFGAALLDGQSRQEAFERLRRIRAQVRVYGKSGRESLQQFEHGVGDALVAWECEALSRRRRGAALEVVYPRRTIRMDLPVVLVRPPGAAEKRSARALVRFLFTPEAQRLFAEHHFRPVQNSTLPPIPGLFAISDVGTWKTIDPLLFGEDGLWAKAAR